MINFSLNWKTGLSLTIVVYLATHFLMVLINGVWWDDNLVWYVTPEQLYDYLGPNDANEIFQYWYIRCISTIFPVRHQLLAFHLISLFVNGCSVVCCWFILKAATKNLWFTIYCSLLIASFGFDTTSMLIVSSHYAFSNLFFYIGFLLLIYDFSTNIWFLRILAALCWFISLLIWRSPALLMPLIILIISGLKVKFNYNSISSYWNTVKYCLQKFWPIIIAVFSFFVIYLLFMQQEGDHISYYVPKNENIFLSPLTSVISSIVAIVNYIGCSFSSIFSSQDIIISLFNIGGILLTCKLFGSKNHSIKINNSLRWFWGALVYLSLSFLLFFLIYDKGEILNIYTYRSRILNLASLPISIIVVISLQYIRTSLQKIFFIILLFGSSIYTINTFVDYGYSWVKSECLVDFLKEHPELDGKTLLVKDFAFFANENKDPKSRHDYTTIAKLAYGKSTPTTVYSYYYNYQYPQCDAEIVCEPIEYLFDYKTKYSVVLCHIFSPGSFTNSYNTWKKRLFAFSYTLL